MLGCSAASRCLQPRCYNTGRVPSSKPPLALHTLSHDVSGTLRFHGRTGLWRRKTVKGTEWGVAAAGELARQSSAGRDHIHSPPNTVVTCPSDRCQDKGRPRGQTPEAPARQASGPLAQRRERSGTGVPRSQVCPVPHPEAGRGPTARHSPAFGATWCRHFPAEPLVSCLPGNAMLNAKRTEHLKWHPKRSFLVSFHFFSIHHNIWKINRRKTTSNPESSAFLECRPHEPHQATAARTGEAIP